MHAICFNMLGGHVIADQSSGIVLTHCCACWWGKGFSLG